ncbi:MULTISPECIES: DNA repair protein RadA [unclassified Nitratiruptor]|uniref:DNA repair protein RadA n=1 Tax=unclassified Nitratiruptor TaxID=2624044 RepID=UPI001915209E|nr:MULTISPECIES: DNA repair protein RadA [unclassified Nitratiruptor]BCD60226.1 DNA repair protein RadA/Sms [Nitratiruptor sp. YY08-10]BCD64285.1 DNA repair protein RadA/Sms [Nitratiruptor sp. YY08-14]
MAKKSIYECQHCGYQSAKWMGKCVNCGAWESFIEISHKDQKIQKKAQKSSLSQPKPITEIEKEKIHRISTGSEELDLVLGGGLVEGSLVLVGGSPGVGKSTLLLKTCANLAKSGKKVLYVSAEESASQIKMRADRIEANHPNLFLLNELILENIVSHLHTDSYDLLVIDSIQTIYSEEITTAPGTVSQVKAVTFELMRIAKSMKLPVFIIGHITKEGSIAGPRVLEHMVDTVLYFEGDSSKEIRMLRGFKNRFGSISEVGIFEMTQKGLMSAKNISKRFFQRGSSQIGSAATVVMEGSRPIILEVQALVAETGYPTPKRSTTGYDASRLTMLLALLEKKLDLPFNQYDVFVNIAGGIKIAETAADLAIVAAILSSFRNRPLSEETIFLGEVGLTGEIKDIMMLDNRLKEAASQGFTKAVVPSKPLQSIAIKTYAVRSVEQIIDWM